MERGLMQFHNGQPVNGAVPKSASDVLLEDGTSVQNAVKSLSSDKFDKSGHTPDMFLGTDEEGNVVEREAPLGSGGDVYVSTTEPTEKIYPIWINPEGDEYGDVDDRVRNAISDLIGALQNCIQEPIDFMKQLSPLLYDELIATEEGPQLDPLYNIDVIIPKGIPVIFPYMFQERYLRSVYIRGSIEAISHHAFSYCTNLETLIIEEGVKFIGEYSFEGCNKLKRVVIPNTVTTLRPGAFSECDLSEGFVLGESVDTLPPELFPYSNIRSFEIPKTVKTIECYSICECEYLEEIIIRCIPKSIDYSSFMVDNNLTIKVPWSEGEVAGAPWGATNATIIYNYTEDGENG